MKIRRRRSAVEAFSKRTISHFQPVELSPHVAASNFGGGRKNVQGRTVGPGGGKKCTGIETSKTAPPGDGYLSHGYIGFKVNPSQRHTKTPFNIKEEKNMIYGFRWLETFDIFPPDAEIKIFTFQVNRMI